MDLFTYESIILSKHMHEVVVVGAVSPTRGPVDPGDVKTPRNTGATPSGASTKLRGAAERSQKSADERPP